MVILDKEERGVEWGVTVKEAINEHMESPFQSTWGLGFNLSHAWDRAVRTILRYSARLA
jgi:hypothetical protein